MQLSAKAAFIEIPRKPEEHTYRKAMCSCAGVRSRLMRFRGTVRKEKEGKRKENTASVRCTHSRVIDYATSRDIILSNR